MEGNVSSVQSRPVESRTRHTTTRHPSDPQSSQSKPTDTPTRDQEKWDAWDANKGLSRTEAKRRYIETLIRTMKTYASDTSASQALVSELEFVWTQVKDAAAIGQSDPSHGNDSDRDAARDQHDENDAFHDAPISQFDDEDDADDNDEGDNNINDRDAASALTPSRSTRSRAMGGTNEPGTPRRWRKRIEAQLIRLNVQIAALSEQVESRSYLGSRRGYGGAGGGAGGSSGLGGGGGGGVVARVVAFVARTSWFLAKVAMVDSLLVLVFLLYLRRRSRERLKDAVRVVLGDAQTVALGIAGRVQQVGSQLAHRT